MRDFTLSSYSAYLQAIKKRIGIFLTFREYLSATATPEAFCLVRHDVDRKPENALAMAQLEANAGVKATYYFRIKPSVFEPELIRSINDLGHEIGYHYECLSDTRGDIAAAMIDFETHLQRMRDVVKIDTISMHGRPLLPYDNRDLWKPAEQRRQLGERFGLLGEIYLDIDYTDIAYINDTGRNWMSGKANRRDKVNSSVAADFPDGKELLAYLENEPHPKMVFQVHPERWSDNLLEWSGQLIKDRGINLIKAAISAKEKHEG